MKKQNKTTEKELNEMKIVNLSDGEFKTLVIRMLKELIQCGNIKEGYTKLNKEKPTGNQQ